jgi:hypothetical protein
MRFVCGDMRDHIVSCKSDYGASCRRYGVLQWWSQLKINVCEIFGLVRFSTFATISAQNGHADAVATRPLSGAKRKTSSRSEYFAFLTQRRSSGLLDDFIRECEHRGRDVEAKSLGSRERR